MKTFNPIRNFIYYLLCGGLIYYTYKDSSFEQILEDLENNKKKITNDLMTYHQDYKDN